MEPQETTYYIACTYEAQMGSSWTEATLKVFLGTSWTRRESDYHGAYLTLSSQQEKIGSSPCCSSWGRMTRVVVLSRVLSELLISRVLLVVLLLLSRVFSGFKIKALVVLVLATMAAPARALCPQFCQVLWFPNNSIIVFFSSLVRLVTFVTS